MRTRYESTHGFAEMWRVGPMWVLHLLYVKPTERGKGHASALMQQILNEADLEGVTIGLQVAGDIDGDNAMTDAQLKDWYKTLGFVHDHRFTQEGRLIRYPAGPEAQAA